MLYQLSHVRRYCRPEDDPGFDSAETFARLGDEWNSSGFPGQLKNRFPQRAGPMTSS